MHELSLAVSAVELCLENANGRRVTKVYIEKGPFSGVDRHAFEFAWLEAIRNTLLSYTEMELIENEGRLECHHCKYQFESNELITLCPKCDHFDLGIISGREFRVLSLEVEDVS